MELLDLLEQSVGALLDEAAALREENRRLRADVEAGQRRVEEIRALQEELAREKQVREQALARVDALLRRIQTVLPVADGSPQQEEAHPQGSASSADFALLAMSGPEANPPHRS